MAGIALARVRPRSVWACAVSPSLSTNVISPPLLRPVVMRQIAGAAVPKTVNTSPCDTLTVFFDGGCPLCSREIAHYQKLNDSQPQRTCEFIDLTKGPLHPELEKREITRETALSRMHVLRPDGEIVRNADAFCEIWAAMPYWRWLVPFTRLPGIMPVANALYDKFVQHRQMTRRELPSDAACSLPSQPIGGEDKRGVDSRASR